MAMEKRLKLLQTFERPEGANAFNWCAFTSPDRTVVAFATTPDEVEAHQLRGGRLRPTGVRFRLPIPRHDEYELSIRPDGLQMAVASADGVQLVDADGSVCAIGEEIKGYARSVAFDRSGDKLWISYEDPEADPDSCNYLCLADLATLSLIDTMKVTGRGDAYHTLMHHPTEEMMSVEVTCGSAGSWLSFVQQAPWGLSRWTYTLERPNDPFFMGGFSADGDRFAVANLALAQLRELRSCELLTEIGPLGENDVFFWTCTFIDDAFVIGGVTQPNEPYYLLFCDPQDLEPRSVAVWDKGDQDSLGAVMGLPGNLLVVLGDRRAGLFKVH